MRDIFSIVRFGSFREYLYAVDKVDINIVNHDGATLLTAAIAYDREDMIQDLLERGIDINLLGEERMTALQVAIRWKKFALARKLIARGADVKNRDRYGNSALWYAVLEGYDEYDLIKLILDRGGDKQVQNNAGRSPEDLARQIGDEKLVSLLGADKSRAINQDGI